MDALLQDHHVAWRSLRRAPSLVAVALTASDQDLPLAAGRTSE